MAQWFNQFKETFSNTPTYTSSSERESFLPNPYGSSGGRSISGGGSASTQFKEKTFPETVQVDQFVPENLQEGHHEQGAANALDTAIRFPTYTGERLVALGQTLADGDNGVTDAIPRIPILGDAIDVVGSVGRNIPRAPVLGDAIDSAAGFTGDIFEAGFNTLNLAAAPTNAHWAWLWDSASDQDEDESIGLWEELNFLSRDFSIGNLGAILNPGDTITKAELREQMHDRGWTDQDLSDIETGKAGLWDFSGKGTRFVDTDWDTLNGIQDMGARFVGDPLNLLFMPGRVASTASGVAGLAAPAIVKSERALKATRGLQKAHRSFFASEIVSRKVQALRLANGSTEGVGILGLSDRMKKAAMLGGATKKALKGYGAATMATTAGQIGLNVMDEVLPGDFDIAFGGLFELAAKMGERKPLSQNDAAVLATLMTVPARSIVGASWEKTGQKLVRKSRKSAPDTDVARLMEPELFAEKGPAAARAAAEAKAGGEEMWKGFLTQVMEAAFIEKFKVMGVSALPKLMSVRNLAAAQDVASLYNNMIRFGLRDFIEGGGLGRRDIERGLMAVAERGGATSTSTKGLRQAHLIPEQVWNGWRKYEPVQAEMSSLFGPKGGPMGVGLQTEVIVDTHLMYAQGIVELALKAGKKTYTHVEVSELSMLMPAILREGKHAPTFQRALTTTAADDVYDLTKLLDELKTVQKESKLLVRSEEYYKTADAWEQTRSKLDLDVLTEANRVAIDGSPVYKAGAGVGRGNIQYDAGNRAAAKASMAEDGGTLASNAMRQRGQKETLNNSTAIPQGLGDAGIGIKRAYDAILVGKERGSGQYGMAGIIMEVTPGRPMEDVLTAMTLGMKKTGSTHSRAVLAGPEIARKGLQENGTEFVYVIGQRNADEWDDVMRYLSAYGDNVRIIDTGEGVVSLVLRDEAKGMLRKLNQTEKRLGKPVEERVHVIDVYRGKKKPDVANGKYSYKQLDEQLRGTDPRYHDAERYIDRSIHGHRGGSEISKTRKAIEKREALAARSAGASGGGRVGTELTRYELRRETGVTSSTAERELVVQGAKGARSKNQWEKFLNEAGLTDNAGGPFEFAPGDRLFRTKNNRAGAVVRADGELRIFDRTPDKRINDTFRKAWEETVAQASEHATWARGIDPAIATTGEVKMGLIRRLTDVSGRTQSAQQGGMTWVDDLADHGFWPSYRGIGGQGEDVLYLVRDVDGTVLGKNQFERGEYLAKRDSLDIIEMSLPQARTSAEALGTVMWPTRAARAKQAGRDAEILAGKAPRTKWNERRHSQILNQTVNKGRIRYIKQAEEGAGQVVPNFEEGVLEYMRTGNFPDGAVEGVIAMEDRLRRAGGYVNAEGKLVSSNNYTAKVLPQNATPYYRGQNEAYDWVMRGKHAGDTHFRQATAKLSQTLDNVIGSRFARELGEQQRQHLLNEFVQAGATVDEVNRFLSVLGRVLETAPGWGGAKWFRSVEKLPPGTIREIADGTYPLSNTLFKGFSPEVRANTGDIAALMQRSGSRVYRQLEKEFPAQPGKRNLGNLIERTYGKQHMGGMADIGLAGARKGAWAAGVAYNVWRFLLDPRWWAMNLMEGDILGMARWGEKVRGVAGGKARPGGIRGLLDTSQGKAGVPTNPQVEQLAGRRGDSGMLSIEETLKADRAASGWMDPRAMYGYVSEAVNVTRKGVTAKTLKKMVEGGSPVMDDLQKLHGPMSPDDWVAAIDNLLFDIDTKGVKATIMADDTAKLMAAQSDNPAYAEFLMNLQKQHTKNYKDIVHTFHGNVNRSNMERLLNSPFLWWPLSYQLKTGKWLIDVLTKSFAGLGPELAGSAALFKLLENHSWGMENNDEYREMMEEHPALFQALGMFLPITPFDLGVYMGRWTRYSGNWVGAQLGMNDPDPGYPQDPTNFMIRSLSLGPVYSMKVLERIFRELDD